MATTSQPQDGGSLGDTDANGVERVPFYSDSTRKAHGSQDECAAAWADGEWPSHNVSTTVSAHHRQPSADADPRGRLPSDVTDAAEAVGASAVAVLYSSDNFRGYQFDTGEGVLMHYDRIEAIRTGDGTLIGNSQCHSTGFAHCTKPDGLSASLPLLSLPDMLADDDSIYEIRGYDLHATLRAGGPGSTIPRSDGFALERDDRVLLFGRDETQWRSDTPRFILRIDREEYTRASNAADVEEQIEDALVPDEVREAPYSVVPCNEYAKTRLSESERVAHREAGGKLAESESRWRDTLLNKQQFRADLQGECVVRHGEWFFIPTGMTDDDDVPDEGSSDASEVLGSHRATRFHGARMPYPRECSECGESQFHVEPPSPTVTCRECRTVQDRPLYVRGQVTHTGGDHRAINLGDEWHRAVTHDADVLMYNERPVDWSGRGRGRRSRRESTGRYD